PPGGPRVPGGGPRQRRGGGGHRAGGGGPLLRGGPVAPGAPGGPVARAAGALPGAGGGGPGGGGTAPRREGQHSVRGRGFRVERWTWRSTSPEETLALGRWLGERAQAGDVFLMEGDLGAGKTLMTKGIALGLGIDPEQVTSPSFTLMQVHHGRLPLYHMDLYRLERAADVEALGLEEFLEGDGVAVVEWAAHLPEGLRP